MAPNVPKCALPMAPTAQTYEILLIEKDKGAAETIRAALATASHGSFHVKQVGEFSEGIQWLGHSRTSAILLGVPHPIVQGFEAFDKLYSAAPEIPILILGDNASEDLAKEAVARGAQDYLLPDHLDYSLPRALRNAIERKAVEDALYLEKERSLVTLSSIGDAVLCTDISGDITFLNFVAETMTGWRRSEATGVPLAKVFRIIDGVTRNAVPNPMELAVQKNRTVGLTENCILIRRDGFEVAIEDSAAPIHDRAGHVIGAVIVFHDVTASRAMSLKMTHLAQHDALTGLPNRIVLIDRITQSISLAHRQGRSIAVIFLDLDHFKYINDSLGHDSGDKLLQCVSSRLVAAVRHSDTVSRIGGDEFVILLSEIASREGAATSAKKMLLALNVPCPTGETNAHISGSIGISVYPENGTDAETLIKNADAAMYYAKEGGRNNCQFFNNKMNCRSVERGSIEGDLRHAIERREFVLHYQSKVDLTSGEITGVEALIRWLRPDRELVLPSKFIPVAEDCGLIVQIGRWVLREACRQAREWQEAGLEFGRISVNVSAAEFRDKTFVAGVRSAFRETGLEGRYLDIELTENVLIANGLAVAAVLQELKHMGIHLAVDDFGTGYSSLSYLQELPVDVLKIDQSFVHRIADDASDSPIARAIIDMGKSLKLRVIAEGIETQQQLTFLRTHRCAEGQGYIFGQPMAAAQFAALLKDGIKNEVLH